MVRKKIVAGILVLVVLLSLALIFVGVYSGESNSAYLVEEGPLAGEVGLVILEVPSEEIGRNGEN